MQDAVKSTIVRMWQL